MLRNAQDLLLIVLINILSMLIVMLIILLIMTFLFWSLGKVNGLLRKSQNPVEWPALIMTFPPKVPSRKFDPSRGDTSLGGKAGP